MIVTTIVPYGVLCLFLFRESRASQQGMDAQSAEPESCHIPRVRRSQVRRLTSHATSARAHSTMSLYGDLPAAVGEKVAPPVPSGAVAAVLSGAPTATIAPPTIAAAHASTTRMQPMKPAFAAAPRALVTPRPLSSTLTPAQRALQIAAAAQRSAAMLQAAADKAAAAASPALAPVAPVAPPKQAFVLGSAGVPSNSAMEEDDADAGPLSMPIPNEYDPRRPNEYEAYVAERDARRREEVAIERDREQRERERRERGSGRDHDRSRDRERDRDRDRGRDDHDARARSSSLGVAPSFMPSSGGPSFVSPVAPSSIAPPMHSSHPPSHNTAAAAATAPKLDLTVSSGEEAFLRRQMLSRVPAASVTVPSRPPPPQMPMQAFVSASSAAPAADSADPTPAKRARLDAPAASSSSFGPTSRVVLLLNMVARGAVDADLADETAEECARFGRVLACKVVEAPPPAPDHEAVRIFVQFDTVAGASQAAQELHGRFFGGRRVAARFVDEDQFLRGQR